MLDLHLKGSVSNSNLLAAIFGCEIRINFEAQLIIDGLLAIYFTLELGVQYFLLSDLIFVFFVSIVQLVIMFF